MRGGTWWAVGLVLLGAAGAARGHPIIPGSMEVVVHPAHVEVNLRVALEQITAAQELAPAGDRYPGDLLLRAGADHQRYLVEHITITADGVDLAGQALSWEPSPLVAQGVGAAELLSVEVNYALRYRLPAGAPPPQRLKVRQSVLADQRYQGQQAWQVNYVLRYRQSSAPAFHTTLLTAARPGVFTCDWSGVDLAAPAAAASPADTRVRAWPTLRDYGLHGIHHILGGLDHLLFVAALVLGAARWWDLFKVVGAFTLAHTLTLTLSVLDLVRLDSRIVEPLIAASIVFVALDNLLRPGRAGAWHRLGVAFAFGLFHGLGFAGGLMEAMQDMPRQALAWALVGFSGGVEAGHQMVVLPLFVAMLLLRRSRLQAVPAPRLTAGVVRYASVAICLAGLFYLVGSLNRGA